MLRFSANLSMLFTEYDWPQRFAVAKQHGFQAVEIQFPYQLPVVQLQELLAANALQLVLFNVAADDLLQGGEGLAAVPEKQSQFRAAVEQSLAYAQVLKPAVINVLPGRCLNPDRLPDYLATFKTNLFYAAEAFASLGINTVFEAINTIDMPGFLIHSGAQMLQVLAEVAHPNLRLQYDIYHMRMMAEDCAGFLQQHLDKIGHIQFADMPGRGQPGTGVLAFAELFEIIAAADYQGWVGAEYKPVGGSEASLAWLNRSIEILPDD